MNSHRRTSSLALLVITTAPMVLADCERQDAYFKSEDEDTLLTSTEELNGPCPYNLTAYRGQNNTKVSCSCGPASTSYVWGTGVYTDDSRLCTAAVHAGVIPLSGGSIVATILPGQDHYDGTTQNGITSLSYGSWIGSYSVEAPVVEGGAGGQSGASSANGSGGAGGTSGSGVGGGGGAGGAAGSGAGGGGEAVTNYDCAGRLSLNTSLDDLEINFQAAAWRTTALEILNRRYADGKYIVDQLANPGNFDFWFFQGTDSFQKVVDGLPIAVHESLHMAGFEESTANKYTWIISTNTRWTVTPRPILFNRSEILDELPNDEQAADYASTYLTGASGAQDIESLLEELNAYTVTLYVARALLDKKPPNVTSSMRDGMLTLMLYTEAYLKVAAEQYPADYQAITGNAQLVDVIRTMWSRAVCLDELTENLPQLGIRDAEIRAHVYDPSWLQHIENL